MPRHLLHFHQEWHASLEGRGKRLFNDEINGGRDLDSYGGLASARNAEEHEGESRER